MRWSIGGSFGRGRVPDWAAGHLTADEYRVFRRLVEGAFRRRGARFRYIERFGVVSEDLGPDHYGEFQLSNLVKKLDRASPDGWAGTIERHLDALSAYEPGSETPYDEERVRIKLYPGGGVDRSQIVARDLPNGIEARLVVDLGAVIRIVLSDDLPGWPVPLDVAWARALANSLAEPMHRRTTKMGDNVLMDEVLSDHPYAASHALALGPLLGAGSGAAVVAVPNQHHLLFRPRRGQDGSESFEDIADFAQRIFDAGPDPISPLPFLWDGGHHIPLRL